MKAPYSMKVNGVWYRAGEEIPTAHSVAPKVEKPIEQEKPTTYQKTDRKRNKEND